MIITSVPTSQISKKETLIWELRAFQKGIRTYKIQKGIKR
jgi:hypothetical protein